MKHLSYFVSFVALLIVPLVFLAGCFQAVTPSADKDSLSITVSESTINSSWRVVVTRLRIDNLTIDLQSNQVAINGTLTPLRGGAFSAQLILKPAVNNGSVTWSAVSASVNGATANSEQLADINAAFLDSWANYVKTHYGAQRVSAVTITDTDITYTLTK